MKNTMIMDVRLRNGFLLKQDITGTDYCDTFLTNDVENVNRQINKMEQQRKGEIGQEDKYAGAISGTGDVHFIKSTQPCTKATEGSPAVSTRISGSNRRTGTIIDMQTGFSIPFPSTKLNSRNHLFAFVIRCKEDFQ